MRLFTFTVLAVAALASGNVVSAVQQEQAVVSNVDTPALDRSLASVQYDNGAKRSLRTHDTLNESDAEEERGLGKKFKFWRWFNNDMDPEKLYKKLGLAGLGQEAYKHKNYKTYLDFSAYWRDHN